MTIIVSVGLKGEIGKGGDLCWHIREDLRRFKALTTGHAVVMGRKTWDSLPVKPLPGRENIVVSCSDGSLPGLEEALRKAGPDAYVIGGASIYRQALPLADRLEITRIMATEPDADTFFPDIDPAEWRLVAESEVMTSGNGLEFKYETYENRRTVAQR